MHRPPVRRTLARPWNAADAPSAAAPDAVLDTAIEDQASLLCAVKERLIRAVAESQGPASGNSLPEVDLRLQAIVQDCVAALGQVQAAMLDESGRRRRMASDVLEARVALAATQARLATAVASTRRARHLALHDPLTALPNRRHFLAQLHAALTAVPADGRPPTLLYIDLDGFKAVNDTHGHGVGDELLRIVASRLTRAVRVDDVVGRLGGDEFACIVMGAPDRAQLCRLVVDVHATVASPLMVGDLALRVCPSIGIATAPVAGITAAALLGHADTAMYLAKRNRSGFAFFDPTGRTAPARAWPPKVGAGRA